jgi:hypothetical protein
VQHVIASQAGSGSQIPKPSSAAKIQEDDRLTSATDLEPRSAPKSQAPTHGTQPDVSSSQLGIVISEEGRSTGSSTKHGKIRPVMFGMNICKSWMNLKAGSKKSWTLCGWKMHAIEPMFLLPTSVGMIEDGIK